MSGLNEVDAQRIMEQVKKAQMGVAPLQMAIMKKRKQLMRKNRLIILVEASLCGILVYTSCFSQIPRGMKSIVFIVTGASLLMSLPICKHHYKELVCSRKYEKILDMLSKIKTTFTELQQCVESTSSEEKTESKDDQKAE